MVMWYRLAPRSAWSLVREYFPGMRIPLISPGSDASPSASSSRCSRSSVFGLVAGGSRSRFRTLARRVLLRFPRGTMRCGLGGRTSSGLARRRGGAVWRDEPRVGGHAAGGSPLRHDGCSPGGSTVCTLTLNLSGMRTLATWICSMRCGRLCTRLAACCRLRAIRPGGRRVISGRSPLAWIGLR